MSIQIPEKYTSVYESICTSFQKLGECLKFDTIELPEMETVADIQVRLEQRLFTLVFVGGFNTGKSSLINVLFQREIFKREEEKSPEEKKLKILCKEDATPTTSKIHIIKWGEENIEILREQYILEQMVQNERLRDLHMEIVDTPGTDSTNEMHDKLTRAFIPKADLVFFVFSVDQPFTVTEREFLKLIYNSWKREILFILNKIDTKRNVQGEIDQSTVERVVEDIREKSQEFLKKGFPIYPLSAQLVKESVHKNDPALLELSGIGHLENYINQQLQNILHHIKLKSAIQTGLTVCEKAEKAIGEEMGKIQTFAQALANVTTFVTNYWNLDNGEHSSALFTDRHTTFKRFDEILENIYGRIDQTFNLGQLSVVLLRGGSDQLPKSFKSDLRSLTETFRINIREDLDNLMENFSRELNLLIREQDLAEELATSSDEVQALQQGLKDQITSLVHDFDQEELDKMLQQLIKTMMISLGGWVMGILVVLGSLMNIATHPMGALISGGLIGGGLIGCAVFLFNRKKRMLKNKFDREVMALRGEFKGNIKTKLQSVIVDSYLRSHEKTYHSKQADLEGKINELSDLKKVFQDHQENLEKLREED